jgi:hypothetical protein
VTPSASGDTTSTGVPVSTRAPCALLSIVACGLAVSLVPTPTTALRLRRVVYRPLLEQYAVTPMAVARVAGGPPEAVRAFVTAVLATAPRVP